MKESDELFWEYYSEWIVLDALSHHCNCSECILARAKKVFADFKNSHDEEPIGVGIDDSKKTISGISDLEERIPAVEKLTEFQKWIEDWTGIEERENDGKYDPAAFGQNHSILLHHIGIMIEKFFEFRDIRHFGKGEW